MASPRAAGTRALPAARQVLQRQTVDGLLDLVVEVVDPELVEVAEHDVAGPVGDGAEPVLQGLLVVASQRLAGLLHLDQHPRLPDTIGERRPPAPCAATHAGFQYRAGLPQPGVTERLEQVLQEDLSLALLVAGQVLPAVADEVAHGAGEVRSGSVRRANARHIRTAPRPSDRIGRI
jgi:hypothetical protein